MKPTISAGICVIQHIFNLENVLNSQTLQYTCICGTMTTTKLANNGCSLNIYLESKAIVHFPEQLTLIFP